MSDARFTDFLAERLGTRQWVLAPKLTAALQRRGYSVAIPKAEYAALEMEWERERYGAPLASLRDAATDMLAALQDALPLLIRLGDFIANKEGRCETILKARAAIAKATGEEG